MNYMPQIVSYLSANEDIAEIYLLPRAFIMERKGQELIRISDTILCLQRIPCLYLIYPLLTKLLLNFPNPCLGRGCK